MSIIDNFTTGVNSFLKEKERERQDNEGGDREKWEGKKERKTGKMIRKGEEGRSDKDLNGD